MTNLLDAPKVYRFMVRAGDDEPDELFVEPTAGVQVTHVEDDVAEPRYPKGRRLAGGRERHRGPTRLEQRRDALGVHAYRFSHPVRWRVEDDVLQAGRLEAPQYVCDLFSCTGERGHADDLVG